MNNLQHWSNDAYDGNTRTELCRTLAYEEGIRMKKTNTEEIKDLKEQVNQLVKHMSDVEHVMLKHEQALIAFKNDIAELQRKQKNTYGVV